MRVLQLQAPLLAALLLAGCSGAGAERGVPERTTSFDHGTSGEVPVDVAVLLEGTPLAGALVQLLAGPDAMLDRGLLYEALTDDAGRAVGLARLPLHLERAELVVQYPGCRALGTDPADPFQPSSRATVSLSGTVHSEVHLVRD